MKYLVVGLFLVGGIVLVSFVRGGLDWNKDRSANSAIKSFKKAKESLETLQQGAADFEKAKEELESAKQKLEDKGINPGLHEFKETLKKASRDAASVIIPFAKDRAKELAEVEPRTGVRIVNKGAAAIEGWGTDGKKVRRRDGQVKTYIVRTRDGKERYLAVSPKGDVTVTSPPSSSARSSSSSSAVVKKSSWWRGVLEYVVYFVVILVVIGGVIKSFQWLRNR